MIIYDIKHETNANMMYNVFVRLYDIRSGRKTIIVFRLPSMTAACASDLPRRIKI